jgi:predicted alpha/beta superfamily hydrolase
LIVGHSYGGLIALEVARNNEAFNKIAVYEPGVSIDGSMPWSSSRSPTRRRVSRKRLDG